MRDRRHRQRSLLIHSITSSARARSRLRPTPDDLRCLGYAEGHNWTTISGMPRVRPPQKFRGAVVSDACPENCCGEAEAAQRTAGADGRGSVAELRWVPRLTGTNAVVLGR
jgi:hypothetical protein